MSPLDLAVVLAGLASIAALSWFFFKPPQTDVQVVDVTVKGGYSPNFIRATAGDTAGAAV